MKQVRQTNTNSSGGRPVFGFSRVKISSVLTVALVSTLLAFTPIGPVTADENTTPETTAEQNTDNSNNDLVVPGVDSNGSTGTNSPEPGVSTPTVPNMDNDMGGGPDAQSGDTTEPGSAEGQPDSGVQSGGELGLPVGPSGNPTPTPIGTDDSVGGPVPFSYVDGGTWQGVTWELRNDKRGGANYELYLGNPNGTTLQTFTPTVYLSGAPWYTNAAYKQNIIEVNIRGPVKAPSFLSWAFDGFVKLESFNDLSPTPTTPFFDVSGTTDFRQTFARCYSLRNIEGLRYWKTNNATIMGYMFYITFVPSFEAIEGWNTNKLTQTAGMFNGNPNLERIDLTGWNLMNVQNNSSAGASTMFNMFGNCPNLRVIKLGTQSRLWPNYAMVPDALGGATGNAVSFLTEGQELEEKLAYPGVPESKYLEPSPEKYMGQWQEIGTGTIDNPNGVIVGTGVQLMQRSQTVQAPGTYVWRPKFEVKLDGNGGNWAALNPNTGQPAKNAFLYVPRPAAAVGGPYQSVNLTSPNPITSLPTNLPRGFYGWTTTRDLLSSRVTKVTPTNNMTVYALWSKLEFIDSPDLFDFGSQGTSRFNRAVGLDPTSSSYTPGDVANGFDLTVGSNALLKWEVTATLDPFTDSATGMVVLPGLVGLDITGMTHKEQTSPPATQLPVFNPNLSLPADGVTSQVVAGSGNNALAGGGVWEINIPFNNVKLNLPPINNTYLGSWESTLTWSLNDLP